MATFVFFLLIVGAPLAFGVYVACATKEHCAATKGQHDWFYFGPTQRGGWPQYWDRQCQACGKFD